MRENACLTCTHFSLDKNNAVIAEQRLKGVATEDLLLPYKCTSPTGNHLIGNKDAMEQMRDWGPDKNGHINNTICVYTPKNKP